MDFLITLFHADSVAHAVLVLSLVSLGGLALGQFRVFRINLGIAGVLFAGLVFGYFHLTPNDTVLDFCRDFGLILFVYAIGLQVGPGFFSTFRRNGLSLNFASLLIVLAGVLMTVLIVRVGHVPGLVAVGLYSGGVTISPSLGAVQQVLKDVPLLPTGVSDGPALGLALAYPFGILGTILAMILVRLSFRVNVQKEAEQVLLEQPHAAPLQTMNIEVQNSNLQGKALKDIPGWEQAGVVVSRLWQDHRLSVAAPGSVLHLGDVLLAVGPRDRLEAFQIIVGKPTDLDLYTLPSLITTQRVMVTAKSAVGRSLQELNLLNRYGVTLTRVMRGSIELAAAPSLCLQFGDTVLVVGEEEAIQKASQALGNSPHQLNVPHLIPMFIGMGLGVIMGSIPFHVPGLPAPVKLGLAGGPLIVAMILARINRIGPVIWYMPIGANFMIREFGLVLFLACVGLRAGEPFFRALLNGSGWYWMACASLITLVPLMIGALFVRLVYKTNYLSLCGFLAGSMNSPALAFANAMAPSDAPAIAFATVYPLVMLLRVLTAQLLALWVLR
ncbi:MAG: putative transporter [Elusimicrobiota bacterium]|jgi:putative transport protein